MIRNLLAVLTCFAVLSCSSPPDDGPANDLINLAHLSHLYEEFQVGDTRLGVIWIYCEAPDYQLVADSDEGFTCVDDVARALVFYCRRYTTHPSPEILEKIHSLTEFLFYMQAENGFFYNFMLPDKQPNQTHENSRAVPNFWTWRAFWALSELNLLQVEELSALQSRSQPILDTLASRLETFCPSDTEVAVFNGISVPACLAELGADQAGLIMIGLANCYRIHPSGKVRQLLLRFGNLLLQTQFGDAGRPPYGAFLSWRNYWHAWGNNQAYGLLYAGRILDYPPFLAAGLKEVQNFYPYCLEQGFIHGFQLAREADSLVLRDYHQFPQIAYGIRPMVFASLEAYAITGDTTFAHTAGRLATWFSGNNPAGQAMYDPATGRTFDGIGLPAEVNHNSGAESTIEALLSLQAIEAVPAAMEVLNRTKTNDHGRD
ncbi:MAG: hypothetical protein H6556_09920 [Lewinellaceae bacterium]|nr:hypothetical protein [Lewinellaceae bacterium]